MAAEFFLNFSDIPFGSSLTRRAAGFAFSMFKSSTILVSSLAGET
jgi:hypothetical protein